MARTFRDLTGKQGLCLAGGCVAYLLAIAAAALMTASMASVQESRQREEAKRRTEPRAPADLLKVPEVSLKHIEANPHQAQVELAMLVRKIRAQDAQPDGFVKSLIKERADLQGLPFLMGGMCRMEPGTSSLFASAVTTTHDALQAENNALFKPVDSVDRFWTSWGGQDTSVGIAALTQIYGPQTVDRRESLAKHLQAIDHSASTRALARAAVFDFDHHVRLAAVDGLKGRPGRTTPTSYLVDCAIRGQWLPRTRAGQSPGLIGRIWCRSWSRSWPSVIRASHLSRMSMASPSRWCVKW